jgi:LacI family transcriptional regulator
VTSQPPETSRTQRPSISDVAKVAGVSRAAVSKVIRNAYGVSPAMRTKVEAAIEKLEYRPRTGARAMRGRSFTIGFEIPQLGNEFFTQVMRGAAEGLAGSEYQLIIAPALGGASGEPVLEALVDRQVDGIIAISPNVHPSRLDRIASFVPLVLLGRNDHSSQYDTLDNDDTSGTDQLMDHLFDLGHRRIAHLTIDPTMDLPEARDSHAVRRAAYLARMANAGIEPRLVYTDTYEPDVYEKAGRLLRSADPPTAIFAGNDTLAIGVLRAVADAGLSAADVSVVGYDDIDLARHPLLSLTTIDQFGERMGAAAIELLMERIDGSRSEPRHVTTAPELRVRASTQPVAGAR